MKREAVENEPERVLVRIPGIETRMTFLSASEDFLATTLAALPGVWGKLQYLSGLRSEGGTYDHWGLTRLHGEAAVARALGEAHRNVFLKVLQTPLAPLLEEAALSAAEQVDIEYALISHAHFDHIAGLCFLTDTLAMLAPEQRVTA